MLWANPARLASPYGYNASYKSILTSSGVFPGYENSSVSANFSSTTRTAHNLTFDNDTIHASSSNACCFVVQDTIDVRFWADYLTHTTVVLAQLTSHITFATQYIDTLVTTNVSTAIRTVNHTSSTFAAYGNPTIPNNHNDEPGPWVTDFSLNGSLTTAFGATITSPTQFYVFPRVNVVHVSAISDIDGLPACATTSTYRATCSTNAQPQSALYITGINSNAETYFSSSEEQRSAMALDDPDVVLISFSEPFVYVPLSDPFPSRVVNENFGYVPQTLIEWMAQESDPPSPALANLFQDQVVESDLTVSTTVTVAGEGCFHPGACLTSATPGATAVPATATVTPEAERLPKAGASSPTQPEETSSPVGPKDTLPPQAPNQPLPAPAQILGSTPVISPEHQVAKPHSNPQGLGALIASAFGITPTSPPESKDIKPSPGPTPIAGYSISIAPSASAVVVNGVTSILPARAPEKPLAEGNMPIAVGSQQISQNAASQYVVAGQTITPGAPPINIQGTEVSLAPSASAIIIAGSTIALSPTNTPGFTVGAEIVTSNSASRLAPSATQVIVGSSTIGFGPTFTPPPLTIGSQTFTANSASEYIINGQPLIPGAPAITISGTPISLAPAATQAVIGHSTIPLTPPTTPRPLLTFNSRTFTANSASDYIIDNQTLIPGAPAITVSNTPISLAPNASEAIIGGTTETLRSAPTHLPPLVIASQTFTANNAGAYVIGNQTVTPGSSGIVVPGSLLAPLPALSVFTVAGQVFTANPTAFAIDGTTISAGGPGVTISGTPIGLEASGVLDVGNSTFTLDSGTSTDGPGLVAFTGKGERVAVMSIYLILSSALTVAVLTGI